MCFFSRIDRGLCVVARNRAGQSDCLPSANSVVDDNDDDDDDVDDDDDDDDDVESRHNSHWLPCNNDDDDDDDDKSGPSRWINYYDAASLYPSSGKHMHTHSYDIIIITLAGSA